MSHLFPTPTRRFCGVVSVLGLALLVVVLERGRPTLGTSPLLLGLLALGVLLGELLPLKIPRRGDDEEVTISTTFAYALLLAGGLVPALVAQVVASVVQDLLSGKPAWRLLFNVGQYTLTMWAAAVVLGALTSVPHPSGQLFVSSDLPGILVAGLALWLVNTGTVGVAVALHRRVPLVAYFRSDLGFSFITGALLLCLSPVLLSSAEYATGLFPLFFFPIYAVYRAGRHAARNEYQATHDQLTNLPNRGLFRDIVQRELTRADDGRPFAVLFMDLDRFKEINDTLGHHYGDRLLQLVGPRLTPTLRPEDVVARLGGDEFAVLLPGVLGAEQAEEVAQRLHGSLLDAFDVDGVVLSIEASMGIAVSGFHGDDATVLLQRADMAMYAAKRRIGGVRVFEPDMDTHSPERLQLLGELRLALQRRELVLHFQPKVSLPSGRCVGFEALVRWQHPTRGTVPPDQFISLAEGTGLIEPLTRYVLELALEQCAAWRAAGHDDLPVAVNVSARNLLESDLVEVVRDLLAKHGVPSTSLVLEVTESAVMADPDKAAEVLTRLHALGVAVALDDFGAGYTSLAQLRTLPLHELKIDRQFVTDMATRSDDEMIVRSIVELGHNLGLKLVAEGVEDAASAERLMASGCESAQGYHFARPIPSGALPAWLEAQAAVVWSS